MVIRFFHSTSYSTHPYSTTENEPEPQPIGVRAYVEKHRAIAFSPDFDIADIIRVRKDLTHSVKFYSDRLATVDPVGFYYLNEQQRIACEEELLYTFYILSADYQLNLFEGNHHKAKKRNTRLNRCANLLNTLQNTPRLGEKKSPAKILQEKLNDSPDKPAAFVGLIIAPIIAETMLSLTTAEHFRSLKKTMSDANFYRLNWVWGGGLDRILLDLIPTGFGRSQQANMVFADIAPVTGYMSWVLYYFRLGIELSLLTKYSLKGSWMDPWATKTDEAIQLGIWERFQTQWELRKFAILNDAFWATANMACFFWLIGSGTLGYMGNALTGLLLIFDLSLVTWGYQEKKAEHAKTMLQYDTYINLLIDKIAKTDGLPKQVLEEHLLVLQEAQEKCELDWTYDEKQWTHDMWYAVALFAAFSMLCCFFFPPAGLLPATVLILGVVGSALSFLITIGAHALATSIEIEKLHATCARDEKKLNKLEGKLAQLQLGESPATDLEIQKLNLDIKHRKADLDYQKSMIDFHKKEIIQKTLSEAMVPAVAFTILVFMPLSFGLVILIPAVILLMMSGRILGLNEPEAPPSPNDQMPEASPSFNL